MIRIMGLAYGKALVKTVVGVTVKYSNSSVAAPAISTTAASLGKKTRAKNSHPGEDKLADISGVPTPSVSAACGANDGGMTVAVRC